MHRQLNRLMEIIGYHFKNEALLTTALTHPSVEKGTSQQDNQRLEYLGDAVLQLCVSQRLYALFPGWNEGRLSRARASLVREESLAAAAIRFELGKVLLLGLGEDQSGGRQKPSVLADAMEAVIAAVYLDAGMQAAQGLVDKVVGDYAQPVTKTQDHKTILQEVVQAHQLPTPTYQLLGKTGPDHAPSFNAQVLIGERILGKGAGTSKKQAEQAAAKIALERLRKAGKKQAKKEG